MRQGSGYFSGDSGHRPSVCQWAPELRHSEPRPAAPKKRKRTRPGRWTFGRDLPQLSISTDSRSPSIDSRWHKNQGLQGTTIG